MRFFLEFGNDAPGGAATDVVSDLGEVVVADVEITKTRVFDKVVKNWRQRFIDWHEKRNPKANRSGMHI